MAFLFSSLHEAIPDIDLNYYACMAETSPVTQGIIVEMFTDKGTAFIRNNQLTISSSDKVEKRKIENDNDYKIALWEVSSAIPKIPKLAESL